MGNASLLLSCTNDLFAIDAQLMRVLITVPIGNVFGVTVSRTANGCLWSIRVREMYRCFPADLVT
jgi:hypothetical protein